MCSKCGNWYIALTMPDGVMCRICAEGKHARNRTGEFDCHWGHTSPTPSEIKMVRLLALCQKAQGIAEKASRAVKESTTLEAVKATMAGAERSFAEMETALAELPEILRWSVVMELPGKEGAPPQERFKHIDAIREWVGDNRRPPEDLEMLERSGKVCQEIASEIPALVSDARISLGQARQAAQQWQEPNAVSAAPVQATPVTVRTEGKRPLTPGQLANIQRLKDAAAARRRAAREAQAAAA